MTAEEFEPEFDDTADDGRGLTTEQARFAMSIASESDLSQILGFLQVTALMEMVCNETDVAEIELEVRTVVPRMWECKLNC